MDPEYDYEGKMAKSQLRTIARDAMDLEDLLEDTTNLPEWVQSKITLAEHNISAAYDYMVDELGDEDEDDEMDEETKPSEKQVRMAKGVAFDPRYKGGNLTGATRTIEKIKKGLSKHPSVSKALQRANEEVEITEASVRKMSTAALQQHWNKHKDQPNPSPGFGSQLKHVAKELKRRKAMKEELLPKQKEVQRKLIDKELSAKKPRQAGTTFTIGNRMHNKGLADYAKKKLSKEEVEMQEVAGQRGRPKKGEGEESDRHIIMQLRSAQDLGGNKEITFRGGKKSKVHPDHIKKILKLHDHPNTKPVHKRMLRVAIAKSPEHLARVAKEIK